LFEKDDETITLLLKEHKRLRSNNGKLQKSIALYRNLNSRLEQQTAKFRDESVHGENSISTCEKENREWGHLVDLYEDRIVKYKDTLEERSDRRICERRIIKKTRESIVAIVSIVTDKSEDEELLREVIELGETAL
jgi:hypothetical protein